MISVYLMGGLGNQMFQYATARALSLRLNTNLFLDSSYFFEYIPGKPKHSIYFMDKFNVVNNELSLDIHLEKIEQRDSEINPANFELEFLNLPDNVHLVGYWQNEKYFIDYADQIRSELTLKDPLSPESQMWAEKILSDSCSVSIHVRRGDYLTRTNSKIFHQLPVSYYNKAVDIFQMNFSNVSLYIFSNDLDWCRKNFKFDVPTYFVDCNDELHGYEDLELMKLCRHHIIANSSFSWWAAWLDNKSSSITISPDVFLIKNSDSKMLYSKHWMMLAS